MAGDPSPKTEVLPAATLALVQRIPLQKAEQEFPKSTVCVTGATGYIAGPIIERLLRAGHTVHATCRDPSNRAPLEPLMALPGASERLKFFKADLTQEGSFDEAVAGCEYVMHVAAPVIVNKVKPGEGRAKLVEPMLKGVENVLGAVNRTPSVRRVVMTSSISAVTTVSLDPRAKPVYGPDDWTVNATDDFLPYFHGKTLSERRAWEIAGAQDRWSLVTVLPSVVLGPTPAPCAKSESVEFMKDKIWAGLMYPATGDMGSNIVDVRDVALVHCLAMVTPGASGRYIASSHSVSMWECTHILAARFPGFKATLFLLPFWLVWLIAPLAGMDRSIMRAMWGKQPDFDVRRTVQDLGLPGWVPREDTLTEMVQDMAAKGMVRIPS